jgi:hypothetical protein
MSILPTVALFLEPGRRLRGLAFLSGAPISAEDAANDDRATMWSSSRTAPNRYLHAGGRFR